MSSLPGVRGIRPSGTWKFFFPNRERPVGEANDDIKLVSKNGIISIRNGTSVEDQLHVRVHTGIECIGKLSHLQQLRKKFGSNRV